MIKKTLSKQYLGWLGCLSVCFFMLSACNTQYAPVENAWYENLPASGIHIVQPGETVYAISVLYGVDVHQLIKYNHLTPPYTILKGQHLYINRAAPVLPTPQVKSSYTPPTTFQASNRPIAPATAKTKSQAKKSTVKAPKASTPVTTATTKGAVTSVSKSSASITPKLPTNVQWKWPARGKVVKSFIADKKGIDIAGKYGDPVYAAAAGQVVYSGSGLANYGKLVIIKNSENYLSAYAYNSNLLVKEDEWVKAGQQIAEMGNNNDQRTVLHFEIRYKGKPVNPTKYLPKS